MSTLQVANLWFEATGSQRIFATSNALIRISSNGGVQIPTGTTAGRPTGENGIIRYNTDTSSLEYYSTTLTAWVNLAANSATAVYAGSANNASFLGGNSASLFLQNTSTVSFTGTANNATYHGGFLANAFLQNTTTTIAGSLTTTGVFIDSKGGDVRDVPPNDRSTTAVSYTLAITDTGKMVMGNANSATAVIYVPNAVFSTGNTIVIYNNSSGSLLVSPNSSVTLRQVGSNTTGNMNVTSFGLATLICVQANTFVLTGSLA